MNDLTGAIAEYTRTLALTAITSEGLRRAKAHMANGRADLALEELEYTEARMARLEYAR